MRRYNVTRQLAETRTHATEIITFCIDAISGAEASVIGDICKYGVEFLHGAHQQGKPPSPLILNQIREYA